MEQKHKNPGRPKGSSTGPARELTHEEIERLTLSTPSLRDRALLWVCLGGGLRVGEACTLTLQCVAVEGSILVQAHKAKGGKSRRVYLAPQAVDHLRAYLAAMPIAAPSSPLFPRKGLGVSLRPNWGCRLLKSLLESSGIPCASSHSLRRTHANTCLRSGANLRIIQAQLGHASLSTTATYLCAGETERAAAVDKIVF